MDNREINRLVAEKVFNWEIMTNTSMTNRGLLTYRKMRNEWDWQETLVPEFSEDILAAWEVLKKMADAWTEVSISQSRWTLNVGYFECVIEKPTGDRIVVEAETGPLAICLAALKVVGVEVAGKKEE